MDKEEECIFEPFTGSGPWQTIARERLGIPKITMTDGTAWCSQGCSKIKGIWHS